MWEREAKIERLTFNFSLASSTRSYIKHVVFDLVILCGITFELGRTTWIHKIKEILTFCCVWLVSEEIGKKKRIKWRFFASERSKDKTFNKTFKRGSDSLKTLKKRFESLKKSWLRVRILEKSQKMVKYSNKGFKPLKIPTSSSN